MWRAVEELLSGDDDATGRLRTELKTTKDGSVLSLRINGRHDVHESIDRLPVIVLDATLSIEIVRHFYPRIELALDLGAVDAPHETVTQVVGLPIGKASVVQLEPGKRRPEEEERVASKRERLVKVVRKLAAGRSCLVITYEKLEPAFADAGPNVETAHFNAIEGIDRWRNVEVLITIGRPLPSPRAIEDMAAALTGKPVTLPAHPASRPGGRPQQMIEQNRFIQLKSGAEVALSCRVFELPEAELTRQAVTEAAVVQAIGRARGVNRTGDNPVEVYMILHDTTVLVAVDTVVSFDDLEPTKIDTMIDAGLVPQWSADAMKLYPGLWPTSQAARKAYHDAGLDVLRNRRNGPSNPSTVTSSYRYIFIRPSNAIRLLRFQSKARGGGAKVRHALVDLAKLTVEDARARIEAALGQLAVFEIVGDPAEGSGGDERAGGA
jgi:hypothetical protein